MQRKFLTDAFTEEEANVIAFGVPIGKDGMKSLEMLREASWFVEFYDPETKSNLLENVRVCDVGNVYINDVAKKVKEIRQNNRIPLMLSRSHLSTFHALQGFEEKIKLIVFDAHTDLHDEYMDEKIKDANYFTTFNRGTNDATWLKRYCEIRGFNDVMIIGLRSVADDVIDDLNLVKHFAAPELKRNMTASLSKLREFTENSKVYISLDLDVFDPSIAPAVEYPEPDGIYFNHFRNLLRAVQGNLVGADVVCLKPVENNQITEFLAVRSIFEILGKI